MQTYARSPVSFVRGQGARLWDSDDREYLDAISGIAVCALGHCHPAVTKARPNQKKVLGIVEASDEEKAKAARVALLASRSNTMLSIPMLFFMIAGAHAHGAGVFG